MSKPHDDAKKNMNQNSNSTMSCKVISELLLPEELIFNILTFIPPNILINSAMYVCKSWATTIGSTNFAETCQRHARSKLGLYVENCISESSSYFLEFKDDVNGPFERTDLGTPERLGCLIGTCDGILLLRNGATQTFVVNPILKCWLRIPPLPFSRKHERFEVLRGKLIIARVPHTAKFKLFFLDIRIAPGSNWYVFFVLRIGIDNSWEEIARKEYVSYVTCQQQLYNGDNEIYWITRNEVIVMDVDKEIIIREYPLALDPKWLGLITFKMMGNHLSCIVHKDVYRTYQIYIFDFISGKWSLYHEMGPFDYVSACGHKVNSFGVVFRLWINGQIIIQVALHQNQMENQINFGYNVKTRQLTKIEGIPVGNFKVWLHTNSLVSLPNTPA